MWTAFSRRQSFGSQYCRTSSCSVRSLRTRRAFRSWGAISLIRSPRTAGPQPRDVLRLALPSAWGGPADEEVGEPAVDDLGVLDVGEVATRVEPACAGARECPGRLRAVGGGDGRTLAAVDEEHREIEPGEGAPIVHTALHEVAGERPHGAQPRRARRRAGARRVLPAHEERHL